MVDEMQGVRKCFAMTPGCPEGLSSYHNTARVVAGSYTSPSPTDERGEVVPLTRSIGQHGFPLYLHHFIYVEEQILPPA